MIAQTVSAKLYMLCRDTGKIELRYQREALTFCCHKGDLIKYKSLQAFHYYSGFFLGMQGRR